jgi:hypothetical protein
VNERYLKTKMTLLFRHEMFQMFLEIISPIALFASNTSQQRDTFVSLVFFQYSLFIIAWSLLMCNGFRATQSVACLDSLRCSMTSK